ncbi:hypothetical protein N7462_002000, partial [Penicillium macrosclerotiorum]|uniref:uncharacterized protein n=1 Tax=Penicillium macrosclerotiorum TaxID=303699 RepID=UPI002546CF5C
MSFSHLSVGSPSGEDDPSIPLVPSNLLPVSDSESETSLLGTWENALADAQTNMMFNSQVATRISSESLEHGRDDDFGHSSLAPSISGPNPSFSANILGEAQYVALAPAVIELVKQLTAEAVGDPSHAAEQHSIEAVDADEERFRAGEENPQLLNAENRPIETAELSGAGEETPQSEDLETGTAVELHAQSLVELPGDSVWVVEQRSAEAIAEPAETFEDIPRSEHVEHAPQPVRAPPASAAPLTERLGQLTLDHAFSSSAPNSDEVGGSSDATRSFIAVGQQFRDPVRSRQELRVLGARVASLIHDAQATGCLVPRASLTFQTIESTARFVDERYYAPPVNEIFGLHFVPASLYPREQHIFQVNLEFASWLGVTAPGIIVMQSIERALRQAGSHVAPSYDPPISEVALTLYERYYPRNTLRFVIFDTVINPQTLHHVQWHPQYWVYGTQEYEEILGTRIGRLVGYLVLGAYPRGTRSITRIISWVTDQGSLYLRFDIEDIPSRPVRLALPILRLALWPIERGTVGIRHVAERIAA